MLLGYARPLPVPTGMVVHAVIYERERIENLSRRTVTFNPHVTSIMLVGVLFFALEIPLALNNLFGLHLPHRGAFIPVASYFSAPLLLIVFLVNVLLAGHGRTFRHTLQDVDIWFLACVAIWSALEVSHEMIHGQRIDLELVFQLFWLQVFYVALRSFNYLPDFTKHMVRYTLWLITLTSLIQILVLLQWLPGAIPPFDIFHTRPRWNDVNRGAFLGIFGILLALDLLKGDKTSKNQRILYSLFIIINITVILISQARGAFLTLLFIIFVVFLLNFRSLSRKCLPFFRDLRSKFGVYPLIFGVLSLGVLLSQCSFTELERLISFNRGLTPTSELVLRGLKPERTEKSSVYIRFKLIVEGTRAFAEQPLIGRGLYSAKEVRVSGYPIHSLFPLLLATYGVCGFIPLVFWLLGFRPIRGGDKGPVIVCALLFLGTTAILHNFQPWFAVLGLIIRYRGLSSSPAAPEAVVLHDSAGQANS